MMVLILGGLGLMVLCGYGIWRLISLLLMGILSANWLMVIGGGVLMYFFIGLLACGVVVGLFCFIWGCLGDES